MLVIECRTNNSPYKKSGISGKSLKHRINPSFDQHVFYDYYFSKYGNNMKLKKKNVFLEMWAKVTVVLNWVCLYNTFSTV